MASTSVPNDPSPAAAASTSAAPGSSQPHRSTNHVAPPPPPQDVLQQQQGNLITQPPHHHQQQQQQQQQQQHQHSQPSVFDEKVDPAESLSWSSPSTPASASTSEAIDQKPDNKAVPALPAPGTGEDGQGASSSPSQTLEVDGKAVALDHLGPMVVGRDGTVSRIANWGEMTEIEKKNTLRILTKRNQVRLAALRGGESSNGSP